MLAYLVRHTDLVIATAKAAAKEQALIQAEKPQFMPPPWNSKKHHDENHRSFTANSCHPGERGVSFGINNLIVDTLSIPEMKKLGCPVTIEATRSVQLPGADPRTAGASTGGQQCGVSIATKAAVAASVESVFLEFDTNPSKGLCDGPSSLSLSEAEALLSRLKAIHAGVNV
nr:hypothetical protein [Hyphomonas sp.]